MADRLGLRGAVTEVAYYGDESHVFVANETGVAIVANVPNEARSTRPTIAIGDQLWVSWDAADTLVLTE